MCMMCLNLFHMERIQCSAKISTDIEKHSQKKDIIMILSLVFAKTKKNITYFLELEVYQ